MAVKKSEAPVPSASWENPLMPNKRLRELYAAMVQLRILESHVAKLRVKASARLHTAPGEEACRVSTMLSLLPGDYVSDSQPSVASAFLPHTNLSTFTAASPANSKPLNGQLPRITDSAARLYVAIGAASAVRKGALVLAFIDPSTFSLAAWKPIFKLAATTAAPMVFVALPSAGKASLSPTANASGLPGVPVDAGDPVALFRVVQESMLRARAGGGPVLMECIYFSLGKPTQADDPITTLENYMLHRKIVTNTWLKSVALRFTARLKTLNT